LTPGRLRGTFDSDRWYKCSSAAGSPVSGRRHRGTLDNLLTHPTLANQNITL